MRRDRGAQWRPRLRFIAAGVCVLCLFSALAAYGDVDLPGTGGSPAAAGATGHALTMGRLVPASLSVPPTAAMQDVPSAFLGLSTEYWSLPQWAAQQGLLERTIALIHAAGTGPMLLRVGGDSADHAFWDPAESSLPRWAFSLAPRWLARLRSLIHVLGVRVILDLNLITDTPAQAAAWAQAARAALPPGSISAFEIGNEPDIYSRSDWLATTAGQMVIDRPLPRALSAADYARDFRADASLLHDVAPRIPLAGPALARPQIHASWIEPLERAGRRWLGMITVHRYPYSACAPRSSRAFPTIARILSPAASAGLAASLRGAVHAAHSADLALRVTELNSVTCGGRPGVSDAFATALWTPETMFGLVRAGVSSADIHVRANTINAPFALTRHGLIARPELYGLILFARALGPHARLVRTTVSSRPRLDLGAWGVRVGPRTLHLVVVDSGPRSVRLSLRLPARGTAYVQRLLAPSAAATSEVTFAGQHLGTDARWIGRLRIGRLAGRNGRYTVDVRRRSAALISVALAPGALESPGLPLSGAPLVRTRLGGARLSGARLSGARLSRRLTTRARLATGARRSRAAGTAPRVARSPRRSASAPRRPTHPAGGRASSRRRSAR